MQAVRLHQEAEMIIARRKGRERSTLSSLQIWKLKYAAIHVSKKVTGLLSTKMMVRWNQKLLWLINNPANIPLNIEPADVLSHSPWFPCRQSLLMRNRILLKILVDMLSTPAWFALLAMVYISTTPTNLLASFLTMVLRIVGWASMSSKFFIPWFFQIGIAKLDPLPESIIDCPYWQHGTG